jgi:phage terminase large subunit-like protein
VATQVHQAVFATDKRGKRIVRTAVLSLGRCNGKTTLAAMLGLCHLAGPEAESRGEVYSAANDRFQAARIFNEMAAIIERMPWLDDRVTVKRFTKELEDVGRKFVGSTGPGSHAIWSMGAPRTSPDLPRPQH